jgi:hypothetical protein
MLLRTQGETLGTVQMKHDALQERNQHLAAEVQFLHIRARIKFFNVPSIST